MLTLRSQRFHLLKTSSFFQGLSNSSIIALEEIALKKKLAKKQFLFNEGDDGHSLFLCASGNIQVFKTSEDGRETVIIQPGRHGTRQVLLLSDRGHGHG